MGDDKEDFVWAVKSEGHLITRKAGASAKEQAKELRDAEPVRTRLARLLRVHTDERAYRIGGDGEETVGKRLEKLEYPEWLVLHDIIRNDKGTNVDHLVIGNAGVFSLNTKHHPNAKVVVTKRGIKVNNYSQNYLHVAEHEAKKVGEILGTALGKRIDVRPVIVIMGAELEVRAEPPAVSVIRRRDLPRWFNALPPTLSQEQVAEIMRVAGRPSTWKSALTLNPWSKGGIKRLYVNDDARNSLGYRDETTGQIHVTDPADLERVTSALRQRPWTPTPPRP